MSQHIISHSPKGISKAIIDYAENVALKWSRYIFTRRVGNFQYGYCTHCKNEYLTRDGLKQGAEARCKVCDSWCKVKASGRSRKHLVDDAYFVFYEKSVANPEAIVARGIYAVRDYRYDFKKTETVFETKAMYVFEPGNSRMIQRPYMYYSTQDSAMRVWDWASSKSVHSLFTSTMSNKPCYCSYESIAEAVKDTPFRYSTWDQYSDGDMVRFFGFYSQYPCIEYLTKLGLGLLVEAKLNGDNTYGAINWRGKNPLQVLRLSKQDFNEMKAANIHVGPLALRLFQISKKDKSNLSFREIYEIMQQYGSYYKDLQKLLKYMTLRKVHSYISKQYERRGARKHFNQTFEVLHTWRDYLADCVELEMDLKQEIILLPTDLHKAHQDTIEKVKAKADESLNIEITKRAKTLNRYRFESMGFILRPVIDTIELLREGNALKHCVGRYAKQYAKGETNLFVIRKVDQPDKPFFTMEIKDDRIVQTRGYENRVPTDHVKQFVEEFTAEKLEKKKARVKVKIAQPA